MNKQELIKKYREVGIYSLNILGKEIKAIPTEIAITLFEQLDEPEKVKIPQFVADWIKYCKHTGVNLYNALEMGDLYFYNYANQKDDLKLKEFFETDTNQDFFARAWLFGYEVEEEKRYLVKIKGNIKENMLVYENFLERYFFAKSLNLDNAIYSHTRKQLEEAGFGWVFDCPGIEIEEVK